MSSLASAYFPRIRYRNGTKRLWDPIWKRTLADRPEERVRLQWVELLLAAGWSRNRISTELPVDDPTAKSKLRADLLCYDEQLSPWLLVECKAPSVSLKQLTAEQAARYNRHIGAPYIMLTNGLQDLWFALESEGDQTRIQAVDHEAILDLPSLQPTFEHWTQQGFLSSHDSHQTDEAPFQTWLKQWHELAQTHPQHGWRYLQFAHLPDPIPEQHYYFLYQNGPQTWAWSLLRGFDESTNLVVALNESGQLKGQLVLRWLPDPTEDWHPHVAQLYLPGGRIGVNDSDHLHLISQWREAQTLDDFADALDSLFRTYQITG
jgi:hypothetical protein